MSVIEVGPENKIARCHDSAKNNDKKTRVKDTRYLWSKARPWKRSLRDHRN